MTLLLLAACVSPTAPSAASDSRAVSRADSDSGRHDPEPDTGLLKGETPASRCPEGMVLVAARVRPYCIDRYEVRLDEEGRPRSLEGVIPTLGVSFREAQAACESVGRHLASSQQWEDAADGVPGTGGSVYVYGDDYDGELCADPEAGYHEVQPTGSHPGCVSAFGTFDQTGNAWEWSDPEVSVDARASLEGWWSEALEEAEGGRLRVLGELDEVILEAAGWHGELGVDEQGLLVLEASGAGPVTAGYLTWREDRSEPRAWLPITFASEETGTVELLLGSDRDGDPMTDKRGGAYYSGGEEGSKNAARTFVHDADFDGSIAFRCAVFL